MQKSAIARELKTKDTVGSILERLRKSKQERKKYRLVLDFDSLGFWQLRRSLKTMPLDVLNDILIELQTIVDARVSQAE